MGKIIVLDENTSNKIAAGEVIERPASLIKELLENSIDAGATSITVEIKNGGITLIKINDNGSGIDEDDVELAFERHATSKIKNSEDLDKIATLGFRGEALASIAAVSSVELISRTKNSQHGTIIKIRGGNVKEVSKTGCPVGTTFIVKDLFYNTPARFKFLKKDSTEAGYISDIITRVALSKPHISLKLISNNTIMLHTPGNNDLLSVIYSLYGKETSKNVIEINYIDNKVKITGFIGKTDIARSTRSHQSIYVNGRYIKSKLITSAIDEAYKTYLLKNKFAFVVLNLEINPMLIDVNVHPTKMEIRFSEEQEIFRSVYHAINNALIGKDLTKTITAYKNEENLFKINNEQNIKANYLQQNINFNPTLSKEPKIGEIDTPIQREKPKSINSEVALYFLRNENNNENLKEYNNINYNQDKKLQHDSVEDFNQYKNENNYNNEDKKENSNINTNINQDKKENSNINANINQYEKENSDINLNSIQDKKEYRYINENSIQNKKEDIYNNENNIQDKKENNNISGNLNNEINKFNLNNEKAIINQNEETTKKSENKNHHINFENSIIIGQLFSTYILLQNENELILIDQHAAHERIRYEFFKEKFKNNESFSQELLTPIVIELTNQELKFILDEQEFFYRLGFKYESFGNNSIILRSIPQYDEEVSIKTAFLEVVDSIVAKGIKDYKKIEDETIYTIACKSAVKANKRMNDLEIRSLLKDLTIIDNPYTCPHGRPTIIKLTKYELEKMFKRII